MSPHQAYDEWKKTLNNPNDSIFYYHPSLERIMLGITMFAIAGDISDEKANELLDDITTDGVRIDSPKIKQLVKHIQPIVISKGENLNVFESVKLIEETVLS